jgi:hypothetical protein
MHLASLKRQHQGVRRVHRFPRRRNHTENSYKYSVACSALARRRLDADGGLDRPTSIQRPALRCGLALPLDSIHSGCARWAGALEARRLRRASSSRRSHRPAGGVQQTLVVDALRRMSSTAS